MNRLIQPKDTTSLFIVALLLAFFGVLPRAQAVVPPPDGGYPGGNTAEGHAALLSLTTGGFNTAVGFLSLRTDSTGSFNTAIGAGTLLANTADENTATGAGALLSNTSGFANTANGVNALFSNTTGDLNTANGVNTLFSNTIGSSNTATGVGALQNNTNGEANTASGRDALYGNTTGSGNTAAGVDALVNNTDGLDNTAIGRLALFHNTGGDVNTAIGSGALFENTNGALNTALGINALRSNTTGSENVALGETAGGNVTTASNVICIGSDVYGEDVSDSCYIGNIWAQSGGSQAVYVNSQGKLGAQVSSRRFKDEIRPINQASEAIHQLTPVRFRYKAEIEPARSIGFGLIAEEVAKISPDLVTRDKNGKPLSVRYDQVNAMLLNEFLKEHKTVQELKREIAALTATVKEQAAQIQKVSAQIEMNERASQTVAER